MSSEETKNTGSTPDPSLQVQPGDKAPTVERIDELVGNSPLVRIKRLGDPEGAPIYIKMENLNPGGSIRDRYIAEILERAVAAGILVGGDTVALAGLDDSAVSAALVGGVLDVGVRIYAPEESSRRLQHLVEKYGAEIVWTSGDRGLRGAVEEAAVWSRKAADRMYVDGYRREAVRDAYSGIAAEILLALQGEKLGAFITSISTGGTFRHVARELRDTRPALKVGGAILGDLELPDFKEHRFNVLQRFSVKESFEWRDRIAEHEGILMGPKGAACVGLALQLQKKLAPDETIVALNPDAGQRYLGWEDKVDYSGKPPA